MAILLLLAAALRIWGAGAKSLWMDEIFSVQKGSMPYRQMLDQIKQHDTHPPLFQTVEWIWLHLSTNRSEWFVRLPSVAAGVIAVWLTMAVGRRLLGRGAAFLAGALMALSWFQIYYSQEARLYAMVVSLVLGQILLLLMILSRRGRAGWGLWMAYGAVGLASLYTYSLCVLSVGMIGLLYLWMERRGRRQWRPWFVVNALMVLIFLPAGLQVSKLSRKVAESLAANGDMVMPLTFRQIINGVSTWMAGPHAWNMNGLTAPILGVSFLGLCALALLLRRRRRPLKILGALFAAILIGYSLMPMPRVLEYDAKHLAFLQPLLVLALAAGCGARRLAARCWFMPLALLMTIPLNIYGLSEYYRPGFQKEDWRGLAKDVMLSEKAGDLILFSPAYCGFAFDHYARVSAPRAGAQILEDPRRQMSEDVRRIWLVECNSPVARPYSPALEALAGRGWVESDSRTYPGSHGTLRWRLFTRPRAVIR